MNRSFDFINQFIYSIHSLARPDFDLRVDDARRPEDELRDRAPGPLELVRRELEGAGGCRDEDALVPR